MKKKLEKTLISYINFYLVRNQLKNNNFSYNIKSQIVFSDFIIVVAFNFFLRILNFYSLLFYQKRFEFLNLKKKISTEKLLKITFYYLFIKVNELIFALYQINYNKEKITFSRKKLPQKILNCYDCVVVGSGPAGSVTALELIKNKKKVLIIEEGGWSKVFFTKHPRDEFFFKWRNTGVSTTVYPSQISYSSARCFGGGSEINSGLYHLPPKNFINSLKKNFDIKNFSYEKILSFSKKVSYFLKVKKNFLMSSNGCHKYFIQGMKNSNVKYEEVPRLVNYQKNNILKKSMTSTYLKNYLKLKGHILLNTKVKKFFQTKNNWEIVINDGKIITAKNIILCCGSIQTNKILLRNGIKSTNKFTFHPMIKLLVKFKKKIHSKFDRDDIHPYQTNQFYPKFIIGKAASSQNFMKISSYLDASLFKDIEENHSKMSIYHITYSIGCGSIIKIPFFDKFITTYKIKKNNIDLVKNSLKIFCKIFFNTSTETIYLLAKKNIRLTIDNYKSQINLINHISELKFSSVHIMGGVNFGENESCVCDSYGRVKGYKNLFINDSSLINSKLLKNPQGSVMAIAQRNVEHIVKYISK